MSVLVFQALFKAATIAQHLPNQLCVPQSNNIFPCVISLTVTDAFFLYANTLTVIYIFLHDVQSRFVTDMFSHMQYPLLCEIPFLICNITHSFICDIPYCDNYLFTTVISPTVSKTFSHM